MSNVAGSESAVHVRVDVSHYKSPLTKRNKIARIAWGIVWALLFRPSPRLSVGFAWRRFLLRMFGARIGLGANIYPSCRIWAPWNLEMGEHSGLAQEVECYSVDKIRIAAHVTISQYSFLCTASHDITNPNMRLITSPITIGEGAWVCAGVFVGPGVTIGAGAVAAARAVVVRDVEPWAVVGGNPAVFIKRRQLVNG